jgi:cytochrome c peroxidase
LEAGLRAPASADPIMRSFLIGYALTALILGTVLMPAPVQAQEPAPGDDGRLAALGKLIFADPSLSASGKLACATCHDPDHAYGPPDGKAVQFGGPDLKTPGGRAVPSLRYVLNNTPLWHQEQPAGALDRLTEKDLAPAGGFAWDGRVDTLEAQAALPLLAGNEMANKDRGAVAASLAAAPYADRFKAIFGDAVLADPERLFAAAMKAVAAFELEDPSLRPYTSKFDLYLDGKAKLSVQEKRGKALFDDPEAGNCASCHLDEKGADGSHPLFTDYQFEALGVPRNPELPQNADPSYYDLGLCGPVRTDQADNKPLCGLFKTPTLRNVASRGVFFHNGRFHTLKEALQFYVERDTAPEKWYKSASGTVEIFDDLPEALRGNVDTIDLPMTLKKGDKPFWNDAQIDDVIAFLKTLDDGYRKPGAPRSGRALQLSTLR